MDNKYILALDQGTTSSRAIIIDKEGNVIKTAQKEFTQLYPKAGWVEHDPVEIWATQSGVAREVLERAGIKPEDIAAIGVTNQRETTIIWEKYTGKPIYNAIVWQCRRTSDICEKLKEKGLEKYIKENTGLVVDAYFSATKIKWILDNVEGAREKADKGELLFGTVDSWIIWNLSRGKIHVTDYSNASRTMLFNIKDLCWDEKILKELDIPKSILPDVRNSSEQYGYTDQGIFGLNIPIAGIAGDQQAALFGQLCLEEGMIKNTYGTGCFILMQTGSNLVYSNHGLLTTISWSIDNKVSYALEGSVFMGGATIQWLRDELKIIQDSEDSEYYATKVEDTNGVYLVPAFTGLGAPYWNMYARGTITGLTRGTNRSHIIRAGLESIAYQSNDVIRAMEDDSCIDLMELRVDGGATSNDFLMQFQADILGTKVIRSKHKESTALGAAFLAGLAIGYWQDVEEIREKTEIEKEFYPEMDLIKREKLYKGWQAAVKRTELKP